MLFLSHSTKDKAAAVETQQRLLSRGYDPAQLFLDSDEQSGIAAGTQWEQVLYERLKDCRALVVRTDGEPVGLQFGERGGVSPLMSREESGALQPPLAKLYHYHSPAQPADSRNNCEDFVLTAP